MSTSQAHPVSSLDRLVSRLEQDIRQRGLSAGDKYLTSSQAAQLLGVSTTTADRAMQLLSKRRMLVRQRNLGTFVGPHFEMKRGVTLRTIYVLMPPTGLSDNAPSLESLAFGLRSQVRDANVQLTYLPASGEREYVKELLRSAALAGQVVGVIPFSCPHGVYRQLADSNLPTVILGTPYADQHDIPSIDVDNRAAGRILTEHLIDRGHSRIVLFTAMEGRPGDSLFYDGVSEALTVRGLSPNSLIMRVVSNEPSIIAAEMQGLLSLPDAPRGFIARTSAIARTAIAVLESTKAADNKCDVVCQLELTAERDSLPIPYTQPCVPLGEIAARIGKMLNELERGDTLDPHHVVIPVERCQCRPA